MTTSVRGLSISFLCSLLVGSSATVLGQAPACGATPCPYLNAALPIEERVKDLVGRMTLEEKASQMQDAAVAIPRLGLPAYGWWNEALHGVARRGVATVFPQAIGMAATWDRDLMREEGETISTEARAVFNAHPEPDKKRYFGLTFWSPNINIFRDPRWGRGQETLGEDPFLTGRLGTAFVLGVQGDDPKYLKAVATPKHYAVHSGPEPLRHKFNVDVSSHDLEDTYLPAFRALITEGHADSIMCAYNAINNAPACASKMLLQDHLVKDWGFKGFVVSDCDAVGDVVGGHHFAKDAAEASALSVQAGTDLDCGGAYKALPDAVKRGLITEAEVDAALGRAMTARFRLGMFDPPAMVPFSKIAITENDSAEHRKLALQASEESIVLLKNDGILPLKGTEHTIAVIGPTAESAEVMHGNYNGDASHPVYAKEGFAARFNRATVVYSPGALLAPGFTSAIPDGVLHPDASSKLRGLKADYFNNSDLTGTPQLTRTDAHVRFDWRRDSPLAAEPKSPFSVRWSGIIATPSAGDWTLFLKGPRSRPGASASGVAGRVKFYLDGKIVDGDTESPAQVTLRIRDTQPHAFRIDYIHAGEDAPISLEWAPSNASLVQDAVQKASMADVVFAFVGLSPQLEGEEMDVHIPGFDAGDKTDIALPATQQALLEALKKTGKPLVVVLNSGSALSVAWAQQQANGILEAWYPGEEGGDAIAAIAAGDVSPSGRLPVTFYRSVDDLPAFTDYSMKNRTYRYYTGAVLYPFGYGLSFAKFHYSQAAISSSTLKAGDTLTATVEVRNDSTHDADEVVEAYLKAPQTKVSPKLFLAGFQRIHLAAGATGKVTIPIDARAMSAVDADGVRSVMAGDYTLSLGGGQPGTAATVVSTKFKVTGSMSLPR